MRCENALLLFIPNEQKVRIELKVEFVLVRNGVLKRAREKKGLVPHIYAIRGKLQFLVVRSYFRSQKTCT